MTDAAPSKSWFWIQFISFQALWFAAVLGGNTWLALVILLIALHFALTPSRKTDWRVIPIALIGIAVDSILTLSGVFQFEQYPLWLGFIWIAFVLTLGHSLAWLSKLPCILLAPIGAAAGVASYLAGWRLGAVEFPQGVTISVIALSLVWAALLPTLVLLNDQIRRQT